MKYPVFYAIPKPTFFPLKGGGQALIQAAPMRTPTTATHHHLPPTLLPRTSITVNPTTATNHHSHHSPVSGGWYCWAAAMRCVSGWWWS